jgi:hypothetical protein
MIGNRKGVVVGLVLVVIVTVLLSGCSSGEYTECGRVDEGTYIGKKDTNLECALSCLLENRDYTEYFWCNKDKKCICN